MHARRSSLRVGAVAASVVIATSASVWCPAPDADAVGPPLTKDEVTQLVSRCAAFAKRVRGRPGLAIAVVDAEANSLGVFRTAGLSDEAVTGGRAVAAALAKAGTAAYFSSDEQTFTTRTAAFIIQDHFPPGVRFMPAGPLYGVEFSSIATTDVNPIFFPRIPDARIFETPEVRVRGDLGGVAIYKNGRKVGGLGIDDGDLRKRVTIPARVFPGTTDDPEPDCRDGYSLTFRGLEKGRDLEQIVMAAIRGRLAPRPIRSDRILVGGIRLPFTDGSALRPVDVDLVADGVGGTWDPDYGIFDGTPKASRFEDFALSPPPGEGPGAETFRGQVPKTLPGVLPSDPSVAFALHGSSAPNGPTEAEVRRMLWQGARQANITRAAIRRPIGLAMQCWITVVDVKGDLLGAFRFQDDATLFSFDVAVQKARTAAFFSDDKCAMTSRALGLFSQLYYPAGQDSAGRGPLFQLQDGLTVGLIGLAFGRPVAPAEMARIRNGITIFPGGVPIYRDGELIGGIGVSGDGVDQDDIVADLASRGFGAPGPIRCDNLNGAQLKGALRRALERIRIAAPGDPLSCAGSITEKALSFFHARFKEASQTLERTELEVEPPYVKHPRHPGPVTIRR